MISRVVLLSLSVPLFVLDRVVNCPVLAAVLFGRNDFDDLDDYVSTTTPPPPPHGLS